MGLSITEIRFSEYRGYSRLELAGLGPLVVLVGPNAVGKTNIIEGIQLLTAGESFRKPSWDELVSWDASAACISARLEDHAHNRVLDHKMTAAAGKRSYEVNGKKKTGAAVRGSCPCVLFIPDHLQLVKASSAQRRDALDSLGVQLSRSYGALKTDYANTLRQRNLLLKEGVHAGPLFESWDESLATYGARLCVKRMRLFSRLAVHMERIYSQLVEGEELSCLYLPSWMRFDDDGRQRGDIPSSGSICQTSHQLEDSVEQVQEIISHWSVLLATQELSRKTSLVGPQKDELVFFINGRNARLFASQGQQRTIVLAWKLAEVELVREFAGTDPVLLLDDVMSELDATRRNALTSFIEGSTQAFITTTNLGYFSEELLNQAQVIELPIDGTRHAY
ncbi:MAG: DNA replication/repair protein RecF [Coriobacteriales bacterium]